MFSSGVPFAGSGLPDVGLQQQALENNGVVVIFVPFGFLCEFHVGKTLKQLAQGEIELEEDLDDEIDLEWSDELAKAIKDLIPELQKSEAFFEKFFGSDRELVQKDFDRLASVTDARIESLRKIRENVDRGEIQYDIDPSILQSD